MEQCFFFLRQSLYVFVDTGHDMWAAMYCTGFEVLYQVHIIHLCSLPGRQEMLVKRFGPRLVKATS